MQWKGGLSLPWFGVSQGGPDLGMSHGIEVGLSRRGLSPSGLRVCMSVLVGRLPRRLGAGRKEDLILFAQCGSTSWHPSPSQTHSFRQKTLFLLGQAHHWFNKPQPERSRDVQTERRKDHVANKSTDSGGGLCASPS